MYGWRGRIGLMVPTGNSVMEPEFHRMAPAGVTTHANRVGVIAFGCTSGSFVGGAGYDDRLTSAIVSETGVPATTTTTAVVKALRLIGTLRIALATPYTDEVTRLEVDYLQANGFEVTDWRGGGIVETADIQECPPEVS